MKKLSKWIECVMEYEYDVKAVKDQIDYMDARQSVRERAEHMVQGGTFAVYMKDIRQDFADCGECVSDATFDLYVDNMAMAIEAMYNV